jgi:hypothetical protein
MGIHTGRRRKRRSKGQVYSLGRKLFVQVRKTDDGDGLEGEKSFWTLGQLGYVVSSHIMWRRKSQLLEFWTKMGSNWSVERGSRLRHFRRNFSCHLISWVLYVQECISPWIFLTSSFNRLLIAFRDKVFRADQEQGRQSCGLALSE